MATTGQFWFLTLGTAKDARVDYIDVLALSGSNTAGAQHVVVDNNNTNGGTTTDLVSNYPEDVQVDWAAGVYFVVINGDPSLGTGGEILMGHTNSAAAPTVTRHFRRRTRSRRRTWWRPSITASASTRRRCCPIRSVGR